MEISRALMTLAFVHDRFIETGDFRTGLAPLFEPIARENTGRVFDPKECSESLRNRYDIVIHPAAVESLAPALTHAGILAEERVGDTALLSYVSFDDAEPALPEHMIQQAISSFLIYCRPLLSGANVNISEEVLKQGLLDRLVKMESLHILLNGKSFFGTGETKSTVSQESLQLKDLASDDDTSSRLDVLCATFLLYCKRENPDLFDLLVRICNGALLAEVVLDLQNPPRSGSQLSELTLLLDGPLVLDLLDLSDQEHHQHMVALLQSATEASARVAILPHTVDEVRGAILAPLRALQRGERTHGPLGRRLPGSSTLQTYASSVAADVKKHLQGLNLEVLSLEQGSHKHGLAQYSEEIEMLLSGRLPGESPDTRLRDAKSIVDVLRLRGDDYIDMPIARSKYVLISRNETLVYRSRESLRRDAILSKNSAAPAITDRQLSGLLWVISGGKADNLTRTQLIANCSAAAAPRRDLITKMYDFLSDLEPSKHPYFEALMTKDRACQVLVEKTLGDAKLVTSTNFMEIYSEIEQTAEERIVAEKDAEIAGLIQAHEETLAAQSRNLTGKAEEAHAQKILAEQSLKEVQSELSHERHEALEARARENRTLHGIANNCLKFALVAGRCVRGCMIVLTIATIAVIAWAIDHFDSNLPWVAYIIGGSFVLLELCAKPDWFIVRPVHWARKRAFRYQARRLNSVHIQDRFEVDWHARKIICKKS